MVIKRKRVDGSSALVEVEADPTDTVDTNGFSDIISTVSAITAKFSDTSTMTPNSGLRVGTLKTVIRTGEQVPRTPVIDSAAVTNPGNFIDGSNLTVTGEIFGIDGTNVDILTVDMGVIATADFQIEWVGRNTVGSDRNAGVIILGGNTAGTTTTIVGSQGVVLNTTNPQNFSFNALTTPFRFYRFTTTTGTGTQVAISLRLLTESNITSGNVSINLRASDTIDTANGTILTSPVVNTQTVFTFDTDLLLVESGQFYTLQIVSFSEGPFDVNLEGITSIKEV